MILAQKIINSLNALDGTVTDEDLKYLWCLNSMLEKICNSLPDTEMIKSYAILQQTTYSQILWHRSKDTDRLYFISNEFPTMQKCLDFINE